MSAELHHDWRARHPRTPRRLKGAGSKGWADAERKAAFGVFLTSPKLDADEDSTPAIKTLAPAERTPAQNKRFHQSKESRSC
jgi:hypothetical protein